MKWRILLVLVVSSYAAFGQAPAKSEFEVASIKPAEPMTMGKMRIGMNSDAGMLRYTNVSLKDCVRVAYRVKEFQVEGPDWLASTRFDIVAKLPDAASKDQIPEMLQALLADRFKLQVHRDTKEHAIYALVVGKGGPKLKPAEMSAGDGMPPPPEKTFDGKVPPPATKSFDGKLPPGGFPRGGMLMRMDPSGMHLMAPSATLANLAEMLSRFCDRPVMDMTGIQGQYDFELTFAPETMRGMPGPRGEGGPPMIAGGGKDGPMIAGGGDHGAGAPETQAEPAGTVHDAVQRYGLKLEPKKAPMEIVFVDHMERVPTEN